MQSYRRPNEQGATKQTIWLTRHGCRIDFVDPDWFYQATHPYDPPLAPEGVTQAKQLAARLRCEGIEAIYTSPFVRAVETAVPLAHELCLPINIEPGLSEWLNPEWFNHAPAVRAATELAQQYAQVNIHYVPLARPHFPETWEALKRRAAHTITRIQRAHHKPILLVGHGASVLGCTWALAGETPALHVAYCALFKLVRVGTRWHQELNGDTSHIGDRSQALRFI